MKIKDITRGIVLGIAIILIILTSCIAIIKVCGIEWLLGECDTTKMTVEQLLSTKLFDSSTVTYLITLIAVLLASLMVAAITLGEKQFKEFRKDEGNRFRKFSLKTTNALKKQNRRFLKTTDDFSSKTSSIEAQVYENKQSIEKLKQQQNLSLRNAIHETIIIEYINIIYIILILPDLSIEKIPPRLLRRYIYQIGEFITRIQIYMDRNSVTSFECKMQQTALDLISEIVENFKSLIGYDLRISNVLKELIDLRKRIKKLECVEMNSQKKPACNN